MNTTLGRLPTVSELRSTGRNDLSCAITKHGGFRRWARELGTHIKPSETTKGWEAEDMTAAWLTGLGYSVQRQATKAHFDLLINECVRVDVKGARHAEYGASCGWFYRMGKRITADVVICARMDIGDFYVFPWFRTPETNLTISKTGGAHSFYHMNLAVFDTMLVARMNELKFPACSRTTHTAA